MTSSDPYRYSLSRKEGWLAMVQGAPRKQPEPLDVRALAGLSPAARAQYDAARATWHANLGPLATPQMTAIHETLWEIVDSNRQDGDRVKGSVAIDAYPGLGKTTIANAFGRDYHRHVVGLRGLRTQAGHERVPVCHVGLTSNTTMRTLNLMLAEFYAHPARHGTAAQLASRALDCVLSCETELVIVDDVHFMHMNRKDGLEVSNHFKWLANEFPVTFVFIGVGLRERGLMSEGLAGADVAMAQTARRWTRLGVDAFEISTGPGRRTWRRLLLAIEQRLVLARTFRGMVVEELSDYLYARSSGHIGSLMTLITRGCYRAIRTGEERLTAGVLDRVTTDEAAERIRQELDAAFTAGRLSSRSPRSVGTTRGKNRGTTGSVA